MRKKLLCFVLAFTLLFSACATVIAKESMASQIGDLNVRFLEAIGVFDSVDLSGNVTAPVTRAEAAGVIVEIMADSFLELSPNSNYFSDVPSNYTYAQQIYAAVRLGVLKGFDDGTFRPEDSLTVSQVAKIYVSMLNYTYSAESKGGYPSGYLSVAAGLGLLSGVDQTTQSVSRIDFARITANAMEVDMLLPSSYGDKAKLELYRGRNMLTEYLGVVKARGTVEANNRGGLRGAQNTNKGDVRISGELYAQGKTAAEEMLGLKVDFYYRDTDDYNPEILYIVPRQYESIMLTAQDMDGIEKENGQFIVSYHIGDRLDEIKVSYAADVIMNGGVMLDVEPEDMVPSSGYSHFLDTDEDGIYDLVQVTSAQTVHVSGVDVNGHKLFDKDSNCYDFSEAKEITVSGEVGDFGGITMGNVVSIYATADGKYVRIVVSTNSEEGVLEESIDEGASGLYRINGKQYAVDAGLWKKMKKQQENGAAAGQFVVIPEIGIAYRFILNADNVIINIENVKSDMLQYGFLCGFDVKEGSIGNKVPVKIMTETGEFKVYTAEKVSLNGMNKKLDGTELAKRAEFYNGEQFEPQLIYFRSNNKDELISIDTAVDASSVGFDSMNFSYDGFINNDYYRIPGDVFTYYAVDANTTVFSVSHVNGVVDEKKSNVIKLVNSTRYTAKVYDVDETRVARILLIEEGASPGTWSDDAMLVDKSRLGYENEEECVRVKGYCAGQVVDYIVSEDIIDRAKSLSAGDVIRPKSTTSGQLTDFEMIVDNNIGEPDANESFNIPVAGLDGIFVNVYGLARYKSDKGIVLSDLDPQKAIANFSGSITRIYTVESRRNGTSVITSGTMNDVLAIPTGENASRVYIQRRYNCIKLMVIYK